MGVLVQATGIKRMFKTGSDELWPLQNINMEVQEGTLSILKGRSGSGKTTLINILGALDYPTGGQVVFDGADITAMPERRRDEFRRSHVGFVFQSVALVSMMTAYENVEFGMRIAGCKADTIKARAEECLNLVGLGGRMHHMATELSGGEQQRVAIARAIAHTPRIIFADEPTAELDTNAGYAVMKLFKELIEKEKTTIIMTSHDPAMMEIADCLFELEGGVISATTK